MSDKLYSIKESTLKAIADAVRAKAGTEEAMSVAEFPDSIEAISAGSTDEAIALIEGTISANYEVPEGTTKIGEYAFYGSSLESVALPRGVGSIGGSAFRESKKLATVSLTSDTTKIGDNSFYNCTSLNGVSLPDSVKVIGQYAFYNTAVVEFSAPAQLQSLGTGAFYLCKSLERVELSNESLKSIPTNGFKDCAALSEVTIGTGVETLGNYAFYGTALKSIELPDTVVAVGTYAFANCSNLTDFTLSKGMTVIPAYCFRLCYGLTDVTIPDHITTINNYAFQNCQNLTAVTIPSSVATIENYAFSSCTKLTSITVNSSTPPTLGGTGVFNKTTGMKIYIPAGSLSAYNANARWKTYASYFEEVEE